MSDPRPARAVVVGIDGSRAATHAALWAVDEAVNRDIPLRLVYVIDPSQLSAAGEGGGQSAARAALRRLSEGRGHRATGQDRNGGSVRQAAHQADAGVQVRGDAVRRFGGA